MNREEIILKLKKYKAEKQFDYNFLKIVFFGSAAKNIITDDNSDIDIIIEQKIPDLLILGTIKTELEEEFWKKIDIIRLHDGINEFLKKRINRDSIYV